MPSSSYDPPPIQLGGQAVPVLVARYDPEAENPDDQYALLPNIWCSRIERKDGAEPSAATFHYILDSTLPAGQSPFPRYFPDYWPINQSGPYVVQPDDELVVFGITSKGALRLLFDGFATNPKASVEGKGQQGEFSAAGVEVRLWDAPIGKAVYRHANTPNGNTPLPGKAGSPGVVVSLDTRFNPNDDGGVAQSNCTPDGKDFNQGQSNAYPCFVEAKLVRDPDPATFWTLAKAVRYILYAPIYEDEQGNLKSLADLGFVDVPDAKTLNTLLMSLEPKDDQTIDPNDASTYNAEDIVLRDTDISGMPPIDALEQLLGYYNFGMRFDLGQDSQSGQPKTKLVVYRKDALGAPKPKQLALQALGATLDPGQSSAAAIHLGRDHQHLYNAVEVITKRVLYEVAVVLAPGFTIAAADADDIAFYDLSNLQQPGTSDDNRDAYRVYVADEAGDGHWDGTEWKTNAHFDWSKVFPADENTGLSTYVERYRPGRMSLNSRDDQNLRRRATLSISRDYAGESPALWDGSGSWQPVKNWKLLKDRFGIEIQADNPEAWHVGKAPTDFPIQNAGEVVRGITSQAKPSGKPGDLATGQFWLMLCTVIEADQHLDVTAAKRKASPTRFAITRRIDAKDHFRKEVVDESSVFYQGDAKDEQSGPGFPDDDPNTKDVNIPRDDTDRAKATAEAFRAAHEFPKLAGSVMIPALSNAYNIGDRLNLIAGVNVTLQSNAGTEAGEAPFYPTIVGRVWEFSGESQKTTLMITDRRAEPQRPT